MSAVQVRGVTKTYGKGATAYQALRGIDFSVEVGELVMLSGPSGSGKTTLLSIIGCVLSATTGEVRLFEELVSSRRESELPALRLSYVGFVFQGTNLIASLPIVENVSLPLELRGRSTKEARGEAAALLDRVGLGDRLESLPADLSGGQRQRVGIARALAGRPPLIVADEPTAALDAANGLLVTEMLRSLARADGRTVIIVTHDSRIFHLADRIVHIEDGAIQKGPQ